MLRALVASGASSAAGAPIDAKPAATPADPANTLQQGVRAVVWHEHLERVAVILSSDQVRVFETKGDVWVDVVQALEHQFQREVRCAAWQPRSGSGLALGCRGGVCLWKDKLSWMSFLRHTWPVTAMAWAPSGRLLASGSSTCASIYIWDVATRAASQLFRLRGAVESLKWSPSGFYLYSGSAGQGFRVWETKTWECELFSDFAQPVRSAAWAQDGRTLLLACNEPIKLQAVSFTHDPPRIGGTVLPLELDLGGAVSEAAGLHLAEPTAVRQIVFDNSSGRLAVCYEGMPGVAIFASESFPMLKFFHVGHVFGRTGMLPTHLSFKPHFKHGALLCVVFEDANEAARTSSSGDAEPNIRFIPMYF